jgi:adenine phosphoribosyltransferase
VLATGNTIKAVGEMVDQLGGVLVGYAFLIELLALKGRDKLGSAPIQALVQY